MDERQKRGFIVPIGGAEEKMRGPAILRRFVQICGDGDAKIAIIPTASKDPDTASRYERVFKELGCGETHSLPYADLPSRAEIEGHAANAADPLLQKWAGHMLPLLDAGGLPTSCPQEIQILQLNSEMRAVFLGGEVLTEIGLHIKAELQPGTTMVAAYSNGVIAYVPGEDTYDLGGYEVAGSHAYYLRPAPLAKNAERLIVETTRELVGALG